MTTSLAPLERADAPSAYSLANARIPAAASALPLEFRVGPDGLADADIVVADSRIEAIHAAGQGPADARPRFDLRHGIVLPLFADIHTHLDKGHIWPRQGNPDGRFMNALEAVRSDCRANWSANDVARRMEFSLRCAYAHGTRLIRTHIDSIAPQDAISWRVFETMRAEWAGRIELQGVSLVGPDTMAEEALLTELAPRVRAAGGSFGGAIAVFPGGREAVANLVRVAKAFELDLDLHVDETEDPQSRALLDLAEEVIAQRFEGRVVAGHCCALAVQDTDTQDRTLDAVARAGIAVVSLPMCNMYLQDRHRWPADEMVENPERTPRWRGVTLLHEMRARGIKVAVASDNTRDPFYAYGDLDGLEVMREATRILHLDHPAGPWLGMMCRMPADIVGETSFGRLAPGLAADFIALGARSITELYARPWSDRDVVRDGRLVRAELPDYAELDDLFGETP